MVDRDYYELKNPGHLVYPATIGSIVGKVNIANVEIVVFKTSRWREKQKPIIIQYQTYLFHRLKLSFLKHCWLSCR